MSQQMAQQSKDALTSYQDSQDANYQDDPPKQANYNIFQNLHDVQTTRNILIELVSQEMELNETLNTNDMKSNKEGNDKTKPKINALVILAPNQYIDIINNIKSQCSHKFTKVDLNSQVEVLSISNSNVTLSRNDIKSQQTKEAGSEKTEQNDKKILSYNKKQSEIKIQQKFQQCAKNESIVCEVAFSSPADAETSNQSGGKVEQKRDQKSEDILPKDDNKQLQINQQSKILQSESVVEQKSSLIGQQNVSQKNGQEDEDNNLLDDAFCQDNGNNQSEQQSQKTKSVSIVNQIEKQNTKQNPKIPNKKDECNQRKARNNNKKHNRYYEQDGRGKQSIKQKRKRQLKQKLKVKQSDKQEVINPKIQQLGSYKSEFIQLNEKQISPMERKLDPNRPIVKRYHLWDDLQKCESLPKEPADPNPHKQNKSAKPLNNPLGEKCFQQLSRLSTAQTQLSYLCQQMKYGLKMEVGISQVLDMYKCSCFVQVEVENQIKVFKGFCAAGESKKIARHEASLICLANMYSSIDYLWQKYEAIKQSKQLIRLKQKDDNSQVLNKWMELLKDPLAKVEKIKLDYDRDIKYENKQVQSSHHRDIETYLDTLKSYSRELILFIDQNHKIFMRPKFRFRPKNLCNLYEVDGFLKYELWDESKRKFNVYQIQFKDSGTTRSQGIQRVCKLLLRKIYRDFYGRYKQFRDHKVKAGLI